MYTKVQVYYKGFFFSLTLKLPVGPVEKASALRHLKMASSHNYIV